MTDVDDDDDADSADADIDGVYDFLYRFDRIDKEFKGLMTEAKKEKNVIRATGVANPHIHLPDHNYNDFNGEGDHDHNCNDVSDDNN